MMNILENLERNYRNKPFLDHKRAVLSAPVRHIFMIATLGYLKSYKNDLPRILEIGSWFGASTLSWAQGLEKYFDSKGSIDCVDAWQPFFDIKNHENEDYVYEMEQLLEKDVVFKIFQHNINTIKKFTDVQFFRTLSDNFFEQNKGNLYDIIFIDADHTYNAVSKDIRNSISMIEDGGIICGDDLNLQLNEVDKKIANINKNKDFIQDPNTKRNYHPGVTIAVDEFFGKVNSWGGFWAIQKKSNTWHNISLKDIPIIYPQHFTKELLYKAEDHYNDIKDQIL